MKTVVMRLNGGMGNQMFQYAFAKAIAQKHGAELKLDRSLFKLPYVPEDYRLDEFALEPSFASATCAQVYRLLLSPKLSAKLRALVARIMGIEIVNGQELIKGKRKTAILVGYFQFPEAFLDIVGALREDFKTPVVGQLANASLARIKSTSAVAVHVRRGNYVNVPQFRNELGVLSAEYFTRCMDEMRMRVDNPRFFLFTNDADWVRANILKSATDAELVDLGQEGRDVTEMAIMRACRHFIVANSTFSWWPAVLGEAEDKIVLAPSPWFRGKQITGEELLLIDWKHQEATWED